MTVLRSGSRRSVRGVTDDGSIRRADILTEKRAAVLNTVDADHYRKTLANLYRAIQKSLSCQRLRQGGADEGLIGVARIIRRHGD
jgi:hypothetical protein